LRTILNNWFAFEADSLKKAGTYEERIGKRPVLARLERAGRLASWRAFGVE
jgi:hypothetical protein